jgi:hypothetical protein
MRLRIYIILLFLLLTIGFVVSRLVAFIQIFFEHAGIAITQDEIKAAYQGESDPRPQYIPKIIHQVYHDWHNASNPVIPSDWDEVRHTCINLNKDWEYKVRSVN